MLLSETNRHADLQQSTGADGAHRDLGLGLFDARKDVLAAGQKNLSLVRQRQFARCTVQQSGTQPRLEVRYVSRDCRLRHVQSIGRGNEATGLFASKLTPSGQIIQESSEVATEVAKFISPLIKAIREELQIPFDFDVYEALQASSMQNQRDALANFLREVRKLNQG